MSAVRLDPESVEEIARRVVQLLGSDAAPPPELVDAAELARRLGVSRDAIYGHADELGAVRVGNRLRFDPAVVSERRSAPKPSIPKPRRRAPRSGVALLPVRKTAA